jgi:hypothetical protein
MAPPRAATSGSCILKRPDGVYVDPIVPAAEFLAAFERILAGNNFFTGLDYTVLVKIGYRIGPDFARALGGELLVRLATDIVAFEPARRALYKAVKIGAGKAEYYFEPVQLIDPADPDGRGEPARLDVDEFIADLWFKGVRFGIDVATVRAAIHSDKAERVVVAHRLEPVPGIDARIVEVSEDIHRSDAPRRLAGGKLDLMAFQNRFPQVASGAKLLRKIPRADGSTGYELSGKAIEPAIPADVALAPLAGVGTVIEQGAAGEFLIARQAGFLSVDTATSQISVGDKIVSRDGVSARTTGNLKLSGDYEEFGEVQEMRSIEGDSITIHADVFGNIVSRGGAIVLNHNLVGGSAHNALGDIDIKGVASGAVIQTRSGEVRMARAESCIISGTKVTIEHAVNCEIMADDIVLGQSEGCALAARTVTIASAAPRRQSEMRIYALCPDSAAIERRIAAASERAAELAELVAKRKAEMDGMSGAPEVRQYMMLAAKIRSKELNLTAAQVPQFQKMAQAVGPALKSIAAASLALKSAGSAHQNELESIERLQQQWRASEGVSSVALAQVLGDTVVRVMLFHPDGASLHDLQAKDIKARLRGANPGGELLFDGADGAFSWSSAPP